LVKERKYLILKNKDHLLPEEVSQLQRLLEMNQTRPFPDLYFQGHVKKTLGEGEFSSSLEYFFCNKYLKLYVKIYNYYLFTLHTSWLEGINKKIKED